MFISSLVNIRLFFISALLCGACSLVLRCIELNAEQMTVNLCRLTCITWVQICLLGLHTRRFIPHIYAHVCAWSFIKDRTWGWWGALCYFLTKCFNPSRGQHVAFPVIHHLTLQSIQHHSCTLSHSLIASISPAYRYVVSFLSLSSLSRSVALSTFSSQFFSQRTRREETASTSRRE